MSYWVDYYTGMFKTHKPKTIEEVLVTCGGTASFINEGVFRRTFKLGDYPIVAKFPKGDGKKSIDIGHTNDEVNTILKIQGSKKLKELVPYLPEFYYYDKKNGVLLMKEYRLLEHTQNPVYHEQYKYLAERLSKLIDYGEAEVDQFGIDYDKKTVICLDFGLIGKKRKKWNEGEYRCL
jgi:hypothetical protein